MQAWKRTVIGHSGMVWCSPMDWGHLSELHRTLELRDGARILDLACGKGALATTIASWTPGATGLGMDLLSAFVDEARQLADNEALGQQVRFEVGDVRNLDQRMRGFDVAACIGARPWGSTRATLLALRDRVRPGGSVIIGETYWRQPPPAPYLEVLGCDADENGDLGQTLAVADADGLDLEFWCTTRPEEFDHYERLYLRNFLVHARRNPDDPGAAKQAEAARRWRDAYLRWGRDTLGFVLASYRLRG